MAIRYKPNGVTLFYINKAGEEISVSPVDTARYMVFLQVKVLQDDAANLNVQAIGNYTTQLIGYQTNLDAGRAGGLTPPVKPLKKSVDDEGRTTFEAFFPALPDPKAPVITLPTGPANPNPPADRIDLIIQLLFTINSKLPDKA